MKILSIVCTLPPYRAGLGNVALNEAQGLATQSDIEHVTLLTMGEQREEKQLSSKLNQINVKPLWRSGLAGSIFARLNQERKKHDIIHLHYPFFGTNELVALFARINKKPLVMTYHMDAKDPGWKKILYWPYQKIWLRLFLRAPQKIICSSYDYIVHSEAAGYFQKHREKFIEIPFGVDTQEFKPGKPTEEFYKKYNLSTQTKYILMVGGLDSAHYFKGVHVLLEAFAKWNKREKENWELIIVGDGDLKKTYQYKAEVLGINKVVHFPGRVAQQNLPDMYRNASIFTLPSLDSSEAFGIVLLEALACGTPSVATNLPGVRQVISSIDGGMIAKPNSANGLCKAWNEVVEKKDKDQNWSNNIASKVEQIFSRKKEIYSLAEVFRSELKSKNE